MFQILGTYVRYLDIKRDRHRLIMMTGNLATKIILSNLQIPLCRHYEIRKDSQKYDQRRRKNCKRVNF